MLTIITNVGEVDLKGVEFQADYAATDHVTLSAAADYADNRIVRYFYAPGGTQIRGSTNVDGNQLPQTPRVKASLSASYQRRLMAGWNWYTRVDELYRERLY
ncbi:MAG: TonB-dependent receptor [Proteobacteria bacterium]|nr:TonB-dependent receptor [Pseudomonadota bacterium]